MLFWRNSLKYMQIPNEDSGGSIISHPAHFSIWKLYVPADRNTLQPCCSLQPSPQARTDIGTSSMSAESYIKSSETISLWPLNASPASETNQLQNPKSQNSSNTPQGHHVRSRVIIFMWKHELPWNQNLKFSNRTTWRSAAAVTQPNCQYM